MFKPLLVSALLPSMATIALAADPLTEAMQKTYTPYRVALFKTNANAQEESRRAVLQAQQGWDRVAADLGARIFAQDAAKVREAIGKLKQPYSRMFIKFG